MASSTNQFYLFLLLITLSSSLHTHARDSHFFNKVPAAPTTTAAAAANTDDAEQYNFLPEKDSSYGLYAHGSSQLPPSTTTTTPAAAQPLHHHLPKNYNPVAYVTFPEDTNSFGSNPNNKYNDYYSGGSSFNSRTQRQSDPGLNGGATYNGGGFQPQGMSDTRFLESGKYFYDLNMEKYSSNHPYERLREDGTRYEYFYGNSENAYEFNGEGYETQDEFEDEVNNLP